MSIVQVGEQDTRSTRTAAETIGVAPERRAPAERRHLARYVSVDLTALALVGIAINAVFRPAHGRAFLALTPLVAVGALRMVDLYRPRMNARALDQLTQIGLAAAVSALVAGTMFAVPGRASGGYALMATAALCLARSALYAAERRRSAANPARVLVVGTGADGQELAGRLIRHPEFGMAPLGYVDSDPQLLDPEIDVPLLGGLDDLNGLIEQFNVERLVVDAASVREDDLVQVLDRASRASLDVLVLPTLARHLSTAISVEGVAGTTLLSYRPTPPRHGISWAAKRIVDIAVSSVALLFAAPLLLAAAAAVKVSSPGPVFFRQRRVGRFGKQFTLLKLRSMVDGAEGKVIDLLEANEADGPYFKIECDPRITPVGRWLRRFSLDELPQLVNVLRGDMSLVGPRPALAAEVEQYPEWFKRRLSVLPGLTGLWQVSGRFLVPFYEAARLDVFYVDHWSLGLDLKILARTPSVVLTGRGAR